VDFPVAEEALAAAAAAEAGDSSAEALQRLSCILEFVSDSLVAAFDLQLIFGLLLTKQSPSARLADPEEVKTTLQNETRQSHF
jgi:hypothetical protein